ncbi:MAG: ATP-binding protein [Fibrobacterales bacterium]|nr:ATP-binding protein [Fibrobacterales bacterium]
MISYLQVKNYRSIVEATIDLRYGEGKAPNGYRKSPRLAFLQDNGRNGRFVPCLALFGANANGKTNLLRAAKVLQRAVADARVDVRKLYDPNHIVTCQDVTEFKLGFVKNATAYEYLLSYSGAGIVRERLLCNGNELYSLNTMDGKCDNLRHIAKRTAYTADKIKEIHRVECCNGNGDWIRPLLNTLGHQYAGLNVHIATAVEVIEKGMHVFVDGAEDNIFPMAVDQLCAVMECDQKDALARIVEVIRKLDVEIRGINIDERDVELSEPLQGSGFIRFNNATRAGKRIIINSVHKNDRDEFVVFDFMEQESAGTKRLASILAYLLCALHRGDAIFIDELDRSLHPILARELLMLFHQHSQNEKKAQLVFTTHCTDLLDDEVLRLSEIGITTKNEALGTKVRRLSDMRRDGKDIRNVSNFRRRYLDGFYSGVPYPAI